MHTELQNLIDAALADGMVTPKEREILHKKATSLDVDTDEVDMLLDAGLIKMQQAKQATKPKVGKCPSCGEPISGLNKVCDACGFVFEGGTGSAGSGGPDLHQTIDELEDLIVKIKSFPVPGMGYYFSQYHAKSNKSNPMAKMMGMEKQLDSELALNLTNLDALTAQADGLRRKVRTYFGDDKKVRLLLEDMVEDLAKKTAAVEKGIDLSKKATIAGAALFGLFIVLFFVFGASAAGG